MEQWEREYLEIIEKQKSQPKNISDKQREYINICWEEIERPDGTKYYNFVKKEIKKPHRKINLRFSLKRPFKALCSVIGICLVLFLLCSQFYVRGPGLRNMCTILSKIESSQTAALNSFIEAGYSISDEEMAAWKDLIDQDLVLLDKMVYHPSYEEVVQGHVSLLHSLQDFIDACLSDDYISSQVAHAQYSTLLTANRDKLFETFKKNFVKYEVTSEGYTFWYVWH